MRQATGFRTQAPLMGVALYVGSFLVFLAGIQLFVLTTSTDHYFAWTIANPMTAAFLGTFYWTAIPLAFLSARQRVWAHARVGVPGVLIFLWATLLTTLLHLGKFHFSSPDQFAKGAAWLWLLIYAADPVLVSAGLMLQLRAAGGDPRKLRRLSVQFRGMGFPEKEITVTGTVKEVRDGVAVIDTVAEQDGNEIIRNAEAEVELG